MTLPVGSIIPKVYMNTQILGAINPCDVVTYINASHAAWFRSMRYVVLFSITLFWETLYYKSNPQATVSTISTESEFMAAVSGSKAAKYIFSILEELGFSRTVPTKLFCENTVAIIMGNSNKPAERARHISVYNFDLKWWVDLNKKLLNT